ncbi:Ig-like domain-containing protein [Cohnella rhizosphaerae]|uniref:Ig-like domain-containing protein n=1 Tax=Cohnella rhizosphaerae TaxID=1457232 RepID=A0A9X4KSQ4_9BACL|nr:Ig-like domain-containing protein [Cohnella rhizosphaerae]MDG0810270.1 Ig-like domain-containing protein [Cohnella rhizosphaerae]
MDNKITGKPFAWQRKSQILTLSILLGAAPIAAAGPAHAADSAILSAPVKNLDVKWIAGYAGNGASGAPITIDGSTVTVDLAGHTAWLLSPDMRLSATSDSTSAIASIDGGKLSVKVLGAGTATIELKAERDGATPVIDRIQFLITKIGDTTGDGLVTSADALYITKVVNSKVPLSDEEINRLDINRDGKVTTADATALLANYVGKTGPQSMTYIVSVKEVNDAPFATGTSITGMLKTGGTLTAGYVFRDVEGDAEGASAFKWYKGLAADGSDKTPIAAADARTYVVKDDDVGYFLFAEITPVAGEGAERGANQTVSTDRAVPDTTPPELAATNALTPTGTIGKGDMAKDFVMTFSEKVRAGDGSIKLRKVSDNSEVVSYAASDVAHVTFADEKATIKNPGLADVTAYYVDVASTAIVDLAGNAYAGTNGSATWTFATPDTTAPVVATKTPVSGAANVLKGADLVLTFNEPVKAIAGKKIEIYKQGGATPAQSYDADDSKVTLNGAQVTIQHDDLDESETYEVRIEAGAFADASDNAFEGLTSGWTFTVPDITPPSIGTLAPLNQAKRVDASSELTLAYNEDMVAAAGQVIKIYDASAPSTPVAAIDADDTSRVSIAGGKITIHNPGLSDNAAYYVDVPAGAFTDTAGNAAPAIDGKTAWSFATPDTIAPTLTSKSPVDGAMTSSKDFEAALTFSEPVQGVAGKHITIYDASDDTEALQLETTNASQVSVNGNSVKLLDLHMADDKSYYAVIDAGAFTDAEGNEYAGISGKTGWRFATPDTTAPTAATLSPAQGATGVSLSADFVVGFSEPIVAGSGTVVIKRATDNGTVASYSVADTSKITVSGTQATIRNPGLADETGYYIEIPSGAFKDASGNAFAGYAGSSGWTFTTPDTQSPVAGVLTPADQATGVSLTDDIQIAFNEKIKTVGGKHIAIRNAADDSVFVQFDAADETNVTVSDKTLAIKHPKLADLTNYYVDIEAGAIADMTGNPFAGISGKTAWRFASADSRVFGAVNLADFTEQQMADDGGAILLLSIEGDQFRFEPELDSNGDPVLDTDDNPVVYFDQANIQLNHAPAGVTIIGADRIDDETLMLSLDYDGTWMYTDVTDFSVSVLSAGLTSGKGISSSAMTIAAIPRSLSIASRSPAAGATDTDKRGSLSIAYDKPVAAAPGKTIRIIRKSDGFLTQSISANDTSKVTISGGTVTIQPDTLNNYTEYYVTMDAGAFTSSDGLQSPAISANTDWSFKTIEEIPGPYFSQYLDAGDGRIAVELYNTSSQEATGYSVDVYKYMKSTHQISTTTVPILKVIPSMPYIYIDTVFYDAMDVMNIWYYNGELDLYNPTNFSVTALVLKDGSGKVIDVLGDPTATTDNPFMPTGGTIIRKTQTYGGSPKFQIGQWNSFPKGTLQYFGTHTN